jgi:hypothetical protein
MGVNKLLKHTLISAAITLGFAAAGTASAIDWVMVQGTEPDNAAMPAQPFGFIQAKWEKDFSDANPNATTYAANPTFDAPANNYVPAKLLGPNLNSQSGFNIFHAQVGIKGIAFPLDDRINYMVLMELGNTALSQNGPVMTDASITMNYVKGARVRMGLFKQPGSEEGMQSTVKTTYMNFSEVANQLLLERFPNTQYTPNLPAQDLASLQNGATLNGFTKPVSGFRDTGIQVFDNFELKNDWNMTYAVMIGQGSGIEQQNVDGEYDKYLYLSAANDGESRMGGLKLYAWSQSGKRLADITNTPAGTGAAPMPVYDGIADPKLYKRDRSGVGAYYLAKPYRVSFEYVNADGMIFEGPDKPSFYFAAPSSTTGANNGATAKANGWYLEGGWYIPKTNWELDARYDTVDLNTGGIDEHKFTTTTLGVKYNFNPKSHFTLNYAMRNFECTASTPQCANANKNLSGVGKKIGVQVTTAL